MTSKKVKTKTSKSTTKAKPAASKTPKKTTKKVVKKVTKKVVAKTVTKPKAKTVAKAKTKAKATTKKATKSKPVTNPKAAAKTKIKVGLVPQKTSNRLVTGTNQWVKSKMRGGNTESLTSWLCSLSKEDQKKWDVNAIIITSFVRTVEKTQSDNTKSSRCITAQDARKLIKLLDKVEGVSGSLVLEYIKRCTHDPEVILDFHKKYPELMLETNLLEYLNIKMLASIKLNTFVGAANAVAHNKQLQRILKKALAIPYLKGEIAVQEVMGW